jgi:peptidoglycan-N-acetylglucosamine deacetylase
LAVDRHWSQRTGSGARSSLSSEDGGAPASRASGVPRPRGRRLSGGSPTVRRSLRATLLIALAATILLFGGLTSSLGTAYFILVDDSPAAVAPGTRLETVVGSRGLAPAHGVLLDVTGHVLDVRGGHAGHVAVDGAPAPPELELRNGAEVTTQRGGDRSEALARTTEPVAYQSRTQGSGPVLRLAQKGRAGEREVFWGAGSGARVAAFVVVPPQPALLLREAALTNGSRAVALTFDDGPGRDTPAILDILEEKRAPATFFWLGQNAAKEPGLLARARAGGFEIENHTWSHADLAKLESAALEEEISRADEILGATRFLRPPYGSYNAQVAEVSDTLGLRLALWDVDTLDWKTRDAERIVAKVKEGARPGAVILFHDGGGDRTQTAAALPEIIDWLLEEGYSLTTMGALFATAAEA